MSGAGRPARALGLVLAILLLGACGAPIATGPDGGEGDIALAPTTGGLDHQLGGAFPTDAAVVVRDAGADPEPGFDPVEIDNLGTFTRFPEIDEAGLTFADACARTDSAPLMVLRDRDLVPEGQDGHLRETC